MRELGIDVAGKISPDLAPEPGRALGKLTDLGWGLRLRALLAADSADDLVPDDVVTAVVRVLAAWDWTVRPAAVVSVPSRTRPQLIRSLAERIAELGRMPALGSLDRVAADDRAAAAGRQHNSAQRLRAVWGTLAVPEAMRSQLTRLSGPVLLVDDQIDTGWTVTVAAMILREAGAGGVLPLTLASAAS
jgi:ATP-dependent DNA helicase RecQ